MRRRFFYGTAMVAGLALGTAAFADDAIDDRPSQPTAPAAHPRTTLDALRAFEPKLPRLPSLHYGSAVIVGLDLPSCFTSVPNELRAELTSAAIEVTSIYAKDSRLSGPAVAVNVYTFEGEAAAAAFVGATKGSLDCRRDLFAGMQMLVNATTATRTIAATDGGAEVQLATLTARDETGDAPVDVTLAALASGRRAVQLSVRNGALTETEVAMLARQIATSLADVPATTRPANPARKALRASVARIKGLPATAWDVCDIVDSGDRRSLRWRAEYGRHDLIKQLGATGTTTMYIARDPQRGDVNVTLCAFERSGVAARVPRLVEESEQTLYKLAIGDDAGEHAPLDVRETALPDSPHKVLVIAWPSIRFPRPVFSRSPLQVVLYTDRHAVRLASHRRTLTERELVEWAKPVMDELHAIEAAETATTQSTRP
jgi:hypothetical protein